MLDIKEFDEHFGNYINSRICNILPQENSEEYQKADREADQILEQLQAALPVELRHLLNDLEEKHTYMTSCAEEIMFKVGFLDGILFAGRVRRGKK